MNKNYLFRGLTHATGVVAYVLAISFLLFNGEYIFDDIEPSLLIPVFMLTLFIISASVTGLLVLGKPIALYLSGLKKEAFQLLFITLAWLAVFLLIVIGAAMLI